MKLENASALKLVGVMCGIVGSILTAVHDETNADRNDPDCYTEEDTVIVGDSVATTTKGDILAITAAVMYATYTIQVRLYCPTNEDLYRLPLLLGYIGVVSLIVTAPIVALTTTKETVASLTAGTLGLMLLKGLFDFLISDYLMFRSIVLTSPTIAGKYKREKLCSMYVLCIHWSTNPFLVICCCISSGGTWIVHSLGICSRFTTWIYQISRQLCLGLVFRFGCCSMFDWISICQFGSR
jgi:hypothetical protein